MKTIEKVHGPSGWVKALGLVRKTSGKLRICLILKNPNKVTKREYFRILTTEETSRLSSATILSNLDASN